MHEVIMLDTSRAILERLQKNPKSSLLMKEFNCRKVTISDIKNKEQIISFISMMVISSGTKRHKTLKKEADEDVKKATYLWFCRSIADGLLRTDPC